MGVRKGEKEGCLKKEKTRNIEKVKEGGKSGE